MWLEEAGQPVCGDCGGPLRPMGRLEGLVDRWFAPPDQSASELYRRHVQMIELLWTAGDRAQELYRAVQPRGVSYSTFVSRVTEVVCRGVAEGWVQVSFPSIPVADDSSYRLEFLQPERFADEVSKLFPAHS